MDKLSKQRDIFEKELRTEIRINHAEQATRVEWVRGARALEIWHELNGAPKDGIFYGYYGGALRSEQKMLCDLTKTKMRLIANARNDARDGGREYTPEY